MLDNPIAPCAAPPLPEAKCRAAYKVPPQSALALLLTYWAGQAGANGLLHITRQERSVGDLARMARVFAPDLEILALPAWDSLPYERARPSRSVSGARVAALARLVDAPRVPRLVLTSAAALLQRVPPRARMRDRRILLAVNDEAEPDWLSRTLAAFGYRPDELVEEPGEIALRPGAADIFPAGHPMPVRLEMDQDRIVSIRPFDPADQRSIDEIPSLTLLPTSESFAVPGESIGAVAERLLPDGDLETLFDYTADAVLSLDVGVEERIQDWLATVTDAWEARRLPGSGEQPTDPRPEGLYLTDEDISAALTARTVAAFQADDDAPSFAEAVPPTRTAQDVVNRARERAGEGDAVVICASGPGGLRRQVVRRLHPETVRTWEDARLLRPGQIGLLGNHLTEGFRRPGMTVIAAPAAAEAEGTPFPATPAFADLRIGDLVVEREHGIAQLTGLALVTAEQAPREHLSLAFAGDTNLLVPVEQAGSVWRYGSSDSAAKPDRLAGDMWRKRAAEVEADIRTIASGIAQQIASRQEARAPEIAPPRSDFDRFIRRIPYPLTHDQRAAIEATLADMAQPRKMERLICGDVGFGKTEVALHAAAAAALAGFQVAVAAPTTLLARQHLETFRRRLSGLGLRVEPLIRSSRSAESRAVLAALQDGSVQIVVGTHALASPGVRFARLGLVVIDEEQRFGEAHKRTLRTRRQGVHALTMTATPLPRSLQAALAGLFDLSILTTPPVARQPVRSAVLDFDPALVRAALLREARRGGQSFVICPRIEELAPMAVQLAKLVPELRVTEVHGRLRGERLDAAMLDFASGRSDVLLSTSIVEAGLDIPGANTMLIWRPDRFGLAQLHQLRGRVGRGQVRAVCYMLTDPAHPLSKPARRRLDQLAALTSVGAGFAISAADLDQRGAGDLLGEAQAGHVRLLGSELYGHVLARAVAEARGQAPRPEWTPHITLDIAALVPESVVPEPDLRLEIYRRLARMEDFAAIADFAEELEDRYGELPAETATLLDLARLRVLCRRLGIADLTAGPQAVALTIRQETDPDPLLRLLSAKVGVHPSSDRLILEIAEPRPTGRLARVIETLGAVSP